MKLQKIFLILIISFSFLQTCFGQNQSESALVDEFEKISNDPLQARVYNFINILKKNNSHGYVITYGTKENPLAKYLNERRIQGCLRWMKYDQTNLTFIFTKDGDKIGGQFWEMPKDAKKPEVIESPHDFKLASLAEPQIINKLNVADEYCPLYFDLQFYSHFLNANPDITGKIVIYQKTLSKYQKEKQKYFRELTKKEKVSPRQIKFVKGKYYGEPDAEFWFVPFTRK